MSPTLSHKQERMLLKFFVPSIKDHPDLARHHQRG